MTKALIIWIAIRLGIIFGLFYVVGWFTTLNGNLTEWEMFDEPFHRALFMIIFIIVTVMIFFIGYEDKDKIDRNSKF